MPVALTWPGGLGLALEQRPPTSAHGSITGAACEAGATPTRPAPDGSVVEGPVGTRGLARAKAHSHRGA